MRGTPGYATPARAASALRTAARQARVVKGLLSR